MWGGGNRLREEFHYVTDVAPLGEVYNVVALKDHADCYIPEMNMTLSELYTACPDWFSCDTEELPIRVNILDSIEKLSIQIHPDDAFAKMYNGGRGKPKAWVILDTIEDGEIQFGHNAKNKEEFIRWTENKEWDKLFRYLKAEKDGFIDIPAGTLHAIGKGVLTYNISRNADCTLRLDDYDRIEPATGKKREIQLFAIPICSRYIKSFRMVSMLTLYFSDRVFPETYPSFSNRVTIFCILFLEDNFAIFKYLRTSDIIHFSIRPLLST